MFYEDAERIERIVEGACSEETLAALAELLQKEGREAYFFKVLSSPDWLLPLKNQGYFDPGRNRRPVESEESPGHYRIPYWSVLDYLERVATELVAHPDRDVATTLMTIVRSVSDYRDDTGERIDNYHTDQTFVKVMATLPVELLVPEDMDRVHLYLRSRWSPVLVASEVGQSLLPALLQKGSTSLVARLLETTLDYKVHERNGQKDFVSVMDDFWLNELMEKNKPDIAALLALQAARIVVDRIEGLVLEDGSQFNVIWIPAVEDHPQNRFPGRYQNILVRAARDFLDAAAHDEPNRTSTLLQRLLAKEHPIFPRIALNCISKHWSDYSQLFWPLLKSPLSTDVSLEHELYESLKSNHGRLSEDEIERILDWIETRQYWTASDGFADEEQERGRRAAQKLEWLTAVKDVPSEEVARRYDEYLAVVGQAPEHPGFSTWMGDVQVGSISPIEVVDLLQKDNLEIAAYLIGYKDEGEWYGKPSRAGLADAFKAAVSQEPQKLASDLSPFLDLPPYYLYYLLWGFKDGWTAKRDFDWEAVLSFCLKLTETEQFWAGAPKDEPEYAGSLVSQVADLIDGGTMQDSYAFDPSLLPLAEELLLVLLSGAPSEMYKGYDLLTAVLNSPKGRVLRAAINYSLRYGRIRKEEGPSLRWAPAVKEDFTQRLDRSFDSTPEFCATAGEYLPNLYWLDKDWVTSNIDRIFQKEHEDHWQAAMAGYLWLGRMYRKLFMLLREHGHYAKALETEFDQEHIRERLIQHLTTAYLWGDEEVEDGEGLFGRLVHAWDAPDLHEIVTYLWMQRGGLKPEQRGRVLALWRYLFAHYRGREEFGDEERELVVDLAKLAFFLDSIDPEALEWLQFSVRNFRTEQDALFLIEYLHQLVETNPAEVATVYLEIIEQGLYPTFDKKHIIPIVETLYAKGEKDSADRICNLYGARRYDFLRSVYDQNQPPE